MKDEKYTPEVGTWLKGREVAPRDSQESARRVASRLPHIRQRSRWWPFPVFHRRTEIATITDTIENQHSPIPASNGHTPTVIGRTQTMFSPVKAIIAGTLVLALGGVMLIAQPFEQQGSVPGAETEVIAPTWVTGHVARAPSCSYPDPEADGGVLRRRNIECSPQTWTSSDPRLAGEVVRRWNYDQYKTDEGRISVWMDAAYLRNDDGGWTCSSLSLTKDSVDVADPVTFGCVGDGGYAGLSASLVLVDAGPPDEEFVGLVFSGDFPPVPDPPAAE